MLRNQQYGEGIDFPIIKQREGNQYGNGIDFPIIKQSGGGRNKQRTVNFTTRSGKKISFKTSSVRRRRQRRGKTQQRQQRRQRGRGGVIPEYLTKEIGEIAGSVGRAAVAEGMSEGVNIAKKGIQFFKNKLLRRRTRKVAKVLPISKGVPWVA